MITYEDFSKVDIRVGQIVEVQDFPEARKPAYRLTINFGDEVGLKKSSAQLTAHYTKADLKDRLVLGVVNLAPRQIGPFMSEALTIGVPDADGECILLAPSSDVPIGGRLY